MTTICIPEPPAPPTQLSGECLINPADLRDGIRIGAGGFGEVVPCPLPLLPFSLPSPPAAYAHRFVP